MRKLLRIGAIALGVVGALVCVAAVGIGWWAAFQTTARLDRLAARLDRGLSEVDVQLVRVESRLSAVRTDLSTAQGAAATFAAENPGLPRVRAEIELHIERLVATFDRADTLADSLRSTAAAFRTATDIVDQFSDDRETTVRARRAIDKIDRAAETLNGLRARVEALRLAKAVELTGELVALAREAIAGAELLAEALTAARQEIVVVRERIAQWRHEAVSWVYLAATANMLVWLWGGLGQLCLISYGLRRFDGPAPRGWFADSSYHAPHEEDRAAAN